MGLLAFMRMDVNLNPDISAPAATVSISQPGAAPPELEIQITRRVEAAVRGINGVNEINSTIREGSSNTFVSFEIGTPDERAISDVRDAIARIRGDLPDGILEPQVNRVDFADEPIGYFSAQSTAMTVEQLSWFIDDRLNRRLMGIEGVSVVSRTGGVSREIRVELDPVRMQAQGVTASQINLQLRSTNLNAAGGRAEIAGSEQSVRVRRQRAHRARSSAKPRSRWAAAARSGSTPSPPCATNGPSRPPTASRTAARSSAS